MKPHLWKLAALAGLVWLAVFYQNNVSRSTVPAAKPSETTIAVAASATPAVTATKAISAGPSRNPTATAIAPTSTPRAAAAPTRRPVFHTVQQGEMPLSIATEYGIAVETLIAANSITNPTTLQIGQKLLIPITPAPLPPPDPSLPRATSAPDPTPLYHVIEKGETPLSIAAKYDITVEVLMIANSIVDPTSLQIGQTLLIPPDEGTPLGAPTIIHEMNSGETLLGLAAQLGSTVEDILASNPDLEPSLLQIGQRIIIPLTQPNQANLASSSISKPTTPRITSPTSSSPSLLRMEQEMVEAINAQRQLLELPAVGSDELITLIAQAHAQDMIARSYFSHVTPEGLTVRDRLSTDGRELYWVGENIIRSARPADETVQYAINWFMNDRPHRANILHAQFTRVGVGVAQEPAGWYTVVVVFAGDS